MAFVIARLRGTSTVVTETAGERLLLGRGTNAGLRFDDTAVALEHAVIERDEGSWALTDRGSVTGTFVNGRRVESVRLADGDVIALGASRLTVRLPGEPGAPLGLEVREAPVAAAEPAPRAPAAPPVDWAGVYRLRQGWLSKPGVSLLATLGALVVLLALAAGGRTTAFRPGPVSTAHASAIGALDCSKCHRPWRGPTDERCIDCHQSHPVHQPTQAWTPPCAGCHTEHRRLAELRQVDDERCIDCHAELRLAGGGRPRFAPRVTDFGTDHPDFALSLAGERLPTTLRFDHAEHLKPDRVAPEGRVTLGCESCHRLEAAGAAGERDLEPIRYQEHCRRCHLLSFDLAFPEKVAPHGEPALVRNYLIGEYSGDESWRRLDPGERLRLVRQGKAPRAGQSAVEAAVRAEADLYPRTCEKCHTVSRGAGALPVVAPPALSDDPLPHARFPHARHGEEADLECADCHPARDSRQAADVLLPGIAKCRECHGSGARPAAGRRRVPSGCTDCHRYHHPRPPAG